MCFSLNARVVNQKPLGIGIFLEVEMGGIMKVKVGSRATSESAKKAGEMRF